MPGAELRLRECGRRGAATHEVADLICVLRARAGGDYRREVTAEGRNQQLLALLPPVGFARYATKGAQET